MENRLTEIEIKDLKYLSTLLELRGTTDNENVWDFFEISLNIDAEIEAIFNKYPIKNGSKGDKITVIENGEPVTKEILMQFSDGSCYAINENELGRSGLFHAKRYTSFEKHLVATTSFEISIDIMCPDCDRCSPVDVETLVKSELIYCDHCGIEYKVSKEIKEDAQKIIDTFK